MMSMIDLIIQEITIMAGSYIDVQTATGSFKAYLSVPEAGQGPGLILCQEIFGVNEVMR